jgi:hypothetical protein
MVLTYIHTYIHGMMQAQLDNMEGTILDAISAAEPFLKTADDLAFDPFELARVTRNRPLQVQQCVCVCTVVADKTVH